MKGEKNKAIGKGPLISTYKDDVILPYLDVCLIMLVS